jgi:polysaccharide biosynthesis/export protein
MMRICLIIACLAVLIPARAQRLNFQQSPTQPSSVLSANKGSLPTTKGRLLAPGDIVEVRIYQEEDLNTRVRVENDGTISLPLLGVVQVTGKTAEQARIMIHDLLAKDYLQKPEVSLAVLEAAKKYFCVLGEVRQPGYYMIPDNGNITLLQAISLAGGYTPYAQPKKISIKRQVDGVETVRVVDAKAMAKKDKVAIVQIEANDTIMVTDQLF